MGLGGSVWTFRSLGYNYTKKVLKARRKTAIGLRIDSRVY